MKGEPEALEASLLMFVERVGTWPRTRPPRFGRAGDDLLPVTAILPGIIRQEAILLYGRAQAIPKLSKM
jgi:hypothetical protein